MNAKIQLVRWWLFVVAVLAAMLTVPDTAWLMPIAFFPGQSGCFCCAPSCPGCTGEVPNQLQVDVAGVANAFCNNCAAFNGTWVLTRTTTECVTNTDIGQTLCYWAFSANTPNICANLGLTSGVCIQTYTDGADLWASLQIKNRSQSQATFRDTTPEHACGEFDEFSIPNVSINDLCSSAAATFTVTAI